MYNGEDLNYEFDYNNEEAAALNVLLNANPEVSSADIRRVALWKLDRVLSIDEATIANLRGLALHDTLTIDDPVVVEILNSLVACEGIWYPMASAILKFIRPDIFPIIDIRAYRALTERKLYRAAYNSKMYVEYTHRLMEISEAQDLPLHQVDQQLYCFDREHNGAI